MAATYTLRRATTDDVKAINALVLSVVREMYGHLIAEIPPPDDDWTQGWVAEGAQGLLGVGLTGADKIDDLWILAAYRGSGIGSALLSVLEKEIAGRGHAVGKLRVVAENMRARRFYARHGWREIRT